MVEAGALGNHVEGDEHAGSGDESEGLHDVGAHVAVLGDDVVIEEAAEEVAYEEWEIQHGGGQASRMTETIWRAESVTSSWRASWRKICSSEGRCMRSRRRPISSSATILPW